jgi:hypothetical protein
MCFPNNSRQYCSTFLENVGATSLKKNRFNVPTTFFRRMLVQLFMKNVVSTFFKENVVTFLEKGNATFYD